jgi:hypothetical protein
MTQAQRLAVHFCFALAFALRLWHLDFGLPLQLHPDENVKVAVMQRLLAGQAPGYFLHPGLMVNLSALAALPFNLFLSLGSTDLQVIGRLASALVGGLTVYPLALLVLRMGLTPLAAVIAAFILTVSPSHVTLSRYLKEDVYLVAGVLISLLATLSLMERPDCRRRAVLAGAAAGLAFASKFVGALMLLPVVYLVVRHGAQRRFLLVLLAGLGFAGTFVLLSPQVLLFTRAYADVQRELNVTVIQPASALKLHIWQWPDWGTYYFRTAVVSALTLPITLTAVIGLARSLRRNQRTSAILLVAIMAGLWYLLIELGSAKRGIARARYALPVAILLTPFAATAIADLFANRRRPLAILAMLILLVPTVTSFRQSYAMHTDTRELAARHIAQNPPANRQGGILSNLFSQTVVGANEPILIGLTQEPAKLREAVGPLDLIVLDSLYIDRLEEFPRLATCELESLRLLREEFPHVTLFEAPAAHRHHFHQATVEVRRRNPPAVPND